MRNKLRTRIGSMLLCTTMLLTLMPMTALATKDDNVALPSPSGSTGTAVTGVAEVGGTQYETLQAAIDAAVDGATVSLLQDA